MPPVPLEQLLAHRDWVRRVARVLVRDGNDADDLEQEVWAEALERPPRAGGSLRGWLAAALRHDLLDRRRSEAARRAREESLPRPAPSPTPEQVVAEAEAHRRVVDAVMDLPEPFRAAVLLRYFQDLDSREIARRTGVPDGTVRTRLHRAIGMLRERLGAGRGGEGRLLLLPLVGGAGRPGAPGGAAGAGIAVGGIAMKVATGAAVAAALLATGGLVWWAFRPSAEGPPGSGDGAAPIAARPGEEPAGEGPAPPADAPADPAPFPVPHRPSAAAEEEAAARKEPGPPPRRVPADRLPAVAAVEALPPEGDRVDVEVDGRGSITVDGTPVGVSALQQVLLPKADARREEDAAKASSLHVVLRVDRDLPWQGTQWLMQACADPKVRVYRIHFAASPAGGGAEGALPAFLPKDTGLPPGAGGVPVGLPVRLALGGEGAAVTTGDLLPWLEAKHAALARGETRIEIDAGPSVATGDVVGALEAARRWGPREIVFRGTRLLKSDSLEEAVGAIPPGGGSLAISVAGRWIEPR